MLLPSIRISMMASYIVGAVCHTVAMCGWRSISRYRLIDIIPSLLSHDYCTPGVCPLVMNTACTNSSVATLLHRNCMSSAKFLLEMPVLMSPLFCCRTETF